MRSHRPLLLKSQICSIKLRHSVTLHSAFRRVQSTEIQPLSAEKSPGSKLSASSLNLPLRPTINLLPEHPLTKVRNGEKFGILLETHRRPTPLFRNARTAHCAGCFNG